MTLPRNVVSAVLEPWGYADGAPPGLRTCWSSDLPLESLWVAYAASGRMVPLFS